MPSKGVAFVARYGFPKVQVYFLPSYLRRDAIALGFILLSMFNNSSQLQYFQFYF